MPFQPQPSSLLSISLKLLKDPVNDEESGELDGLFLFRVQEQFILTVFGTAHMVFVQSPNTKTLQMQSKASLKWPRVRFGWSAERLLSVPDARISL